MGIFTAHFHCLNAELERMKFTIKNGFQVYLKYININLQSFLLELQPEVFDFDCL